MNFEIANIDDLILTYDDAKLYCFSLVHEGKTGWRLPTIEELVEFYSAVHDPDTYTKYMRYYWSSTPSSAAGFQQIMFFDTGNIMPDDKDSDIGCYFIPVRDLS